MCVRAHRSLVYLVIAGAILVRVCTAQIHVGTIRGVFHDETRGVLEGVRVTLDNAISGYHRSTLSSADGGFVFHNVPFGAYTIRAESPRFQVFSETVSVRSNVPLEIQVQFKLSPLTEDILVVPVRELVEKDSSSMHVTVDASFIERQPGAAPSRGLQPLISTLPGWTGDDGGLLHIRGTDDEILYVVDGIPILDRLDPRFSAPVNLETIRSMELITGDIPAEYGNRLGAVVVVQSKSGIETPSFGSVQVGGGNFRNGEISLESGVKFSEKLGVFVAAASSGSHRFLDPPGIRNFGNAGGTGQLNLRLDWRPSTHDTFLFHLWNGLSRFRVANSAEQEEEGNRQKARLRNDSQSVIWQHVWSSNSVSNLAVYRRSFSSRVAPGPRDSPFMVTQDRTHGRQGLIGNFSHQRRGHTLKFGMEGVRTTPRETFSYAVTDDEEAEELGFTAAARSFVPGRPFEFAGRRTFGQVSGFAQDFFSPFKNFTLSLGLRYDYSHQLISAQHWSPRIGGVYYSPRLKAAFRGSFNRLFASPPVENLLVSASEQARRLSPLADAGGGYTPIKPGTVSAYEVGCAHDVLGFARLDLDYYWRSFVNFGDPNVFFSTTIIFPNSVARGGVHGLDVRLDVPERRGWSGYVSYNNQNIYQIGPINGGLFLTAELSRFGPGVRFIPDQDQRNSGSLSISYHHRKSGAWASFAGAHESGTPLDIEEGEADRLTDQLRRQGVEPDAVVDLKTGRVKPRTLLNFSTGMGLLRKERLSVSVQFDIQNLANRLFAYNVGNPFSGTHFGYPRLYSARLKLTFR